ncbi:MAG: tetratricopeptide repeat protein [Alphaproteobacteria bacterium]|nr:tetratricopeptide repeat protein [Thalassospira sp.]MCE2965034.1 tetratricopeptide repeat protein [Alphaproteobacteria bacterium]
MKQPPSKIPTIAPEEGESVWREAAADVQQERLVQFFSRHGRKLSTAVVLLLFTVVGWQSYQNWRYEKNAAAAEQFAGAMRILDSQPNDAGALAALNAIQDSGASGYAALSSLLLTKKSDDAAAQRDALIAFAGNSSVDALLRQIAAVAAGYRTLALNQPLPAALLTMLDDSIKTNNGFAPMAREIKALEAHQRGDNTAAISLLTALSQDVSAPPALRQRAAAYLSVLENQKL